MAPTEGRVTGTGQCKHKAVSNSSVRQNYWSLQDPQLNEREFQMRTVKALVDNANNVLGAVSNSWSADLRQRPASCTVPLLQQRHQVTNDLSALTAITQRTATKWSFSILITSPTTTLCHSSSTSFPSRSTRDNRLFTWLSLRCRCYGNTKHKWFKTWATEKL